MTASRLESWSRIGATACLKRPGSVLAFCIALFVFALLAPHIFISIRPGEAGVLYRWLRGGTETRAIYGEGLQVVCPWDKLYIYNARLQEASRTFEVMTRDGLNVTLGVSIQYRPERGALARLHRDIGPEYPEKFVVPMVAQVLRVEVGKSTAEELFTTRRPILTRAVEEAIRRVSPRYVAVNDVIVRSIRLPPAIQKAVEDKITQQHLAEAYEFRLARERQEAKRKEIDANGQKVYNDTIAGSLTPEILQWKGIEATRELSASPNSKVIVIGKGAAGMPIILGPDK